MAIGLDLKPLTDESIAEMGYETHDLWLVKIGSIVFGPYETESLKHYVSDNEHLFETAQAMRMDNPGYQPFWNHAIFQRRKIQSVHSEVKTHEGPFWLMNAGLKIGPFNFQEIDKKIEMGLLGMIDRISVDDGHSWKKIYEIPGLDRRVHLPSELPIAPPDACFEESKNLLAKKMGHSRIHTSDELASLAYSGQQQATVIPFKIEEMSLVIPKNTEISQSFRWILPAGAAAFFLTVLTTGYFMFRSDKAPIVVEAEESKQFFKTPAKRVMSHRPMPIQQRTPASVGYRHPAPPPQAFHNESRFPTHMETHENYQEPAPEQDPIEAPIEAEQPQEHSLVSGATEPADQSLDAAMNGANQPVEQQPIEEATDF